MKTLLTTLNAKYIHTSLALRLLYNANYTMYDIDFKEYVLKDTIEDITSDILSQNIGIVGISTYIWNVTKVKELCATLKRKKPDIIIILGGPEVTYDPQYFLSHFMIDYVVSGEGEKVLGELLACILRNEISNVEGVSYKKGNQIHISKKIAQVNLDDLEMLPFPYLLERDKDSLSNRIIYFESSRGCPHQCRYCLSSLEKGMRFFSETYVFNELKLLMEHNVRTIKFLDRSFNANPKYAIKILDFIIKHHQQGQIFQFEINADIMSQEIIDYVNQYAPKGLIRFEIGIQSTYEPTNKEISRYQDFKQLSKNILSFLHHDKVTLHLDLIAGLPYENYQRFKQSFDDVFAFRAPELQLGFLKMLRGTSLRNQSELYQYQYDQEAPYEIISNQWLSKEDIANIHLVEEMLEKYWNSGYFKTSLPKILDLFPSNFDFFYHLGNYYQTHHYSFNRYQLDDLFKRLHLFLMSQNIEMLDVLKYDYFHCFKIRPKRFWDDLITLEEKREYNNKILNDKDFLSRHSLNQEILYRYTMLERKNQSTIYLAIYKDHRLKLLEYDI